MEKESIGSVFALYPSLAAVLGTRDAQGKANFMLVAHVGIVSHKHLTLSIHKTKTLENILATKRVSINLVNDKMLAAADYCGMVSGSKADKSNVFEYTEGKNGLPVINDSDLVMECTMVDDWQIDHFDNIVCTVDNTYVSKGMTDAKGKPDWAKIKPILFEMPSYKYIHTGDIAGDCMKLGKEWKAANDKQAQ